MFARKEARCWEGRAWRSRILEQRRGKSEPWGYYNEARGSAGSRETVIPNVAPCSILVHVHNVSVFLVQWC